MKAKNVTIIGLNRLGASMALALRQTDLELHITGYDRDDRISKKAQSEKIIDKSRWNIVAAVADADIIILATPFNELEKTLKEIGREVQGHALLLDMSPLKMPAQKWADKYLKQGHFIGIVPILAANKLNSPENGLAGAEAEMFQNSLMCIIPSVTADPKAVDSTVNLGKLLGAEPFFIDQMEYDALAVASETLPGLMAAGLFGAVNSTTGWQDILRFAGSPFALATLPMQREADIAGMAIKNKAATLHWLNVLIEQLKLLSEQIQAGDEEHLGHYFTELGIERDKWLLKREKNQWNESEAADWTSISLKDHLIGYRPSGSE